MSREPVRRFESSFAEWLGVKHAYAFWKGRVAMYALMHAMGIGECDEVILSGYTCMAVPVPVKYLGARPVYIDIEPVTYNMNPGLIEPKISRKTKLIVMQHTYGYPAEIDAIMDIANRHGIPVIEDSCLAVGSMFHGRKTGTFARASYWSFQWNKTFTTGFGGLVTTDDADLSRRINEFCLAEVPKPSTKAAAMLAAMRWVYPLLCQTRIKRLTESVYRNMTEAGLLSTNPPLTEQLQMHETFLRAMGSAQAGVGLRKLQALEANLAHRRRLARIYDRLFKEIDWWTPRLPDNVDPVLVRYPVRVADKAKALSEASRNMVEMGSWFECPIHPKETPLEALDYAGGMCPEAEKAAREVVNLPTHLRIDENAARKCVALIQRIGPARWGKSRLADQCLS